MRTGVVFMLMIKFVVGASFNSECWCDWNDMKWCVTNTETLSNADVCEDGFFYEHKTVRRFGNR
jgi:hypothetical protein